MITTSIQRYVPPSVEMLAPTIPPDTKPEPTTLPVFKPGLKTQLSHRIDAPGVVTEWRSYDEHKYW